MILDDAARYDRIRSKYKRREKSKGGVASNDSNSGFDREYLVLFIWEE